MERDEKEIRNLVCYECAPCEININDVHLLRSIFRIFTIAICYHCQFHTFSIYGKKKIEIFFSPLFTFELVLNIHRRLV